MPSSTLILQTSHQSTSQPARTNFANYHPTYLRHIPQCLANLAVPPPLRRSVQLPHQHAQRLLSPPRPARPALSPHRPLSSMRRHRLKPHLSKARAVVSLPTWPALQRKLPRRLSFLLSYANDMHSGVAVGSSIGHAIGGFFGGGSSAAAPADQPVAQTEQGQTVMNQSYQAPKVCETDVGNFKRCMDENQGSLTICGWYLDQLKACQQAASQY